MNTLPSSNRWHNYVLRKGDGFAPFWEQFLQSGIRHVLFVLGVGFDPRMCMCVEAIVRVPAEGRRDCIAIQFDEGASSPSRLHDSLIQGNLGRLNGLFRGRGSLNYKRIEMWSPDGRRRVGARNVAGLFSSAQEVSEYTDIIVDISALPRTLYVPLLAKLLYLVDRQDNDLAPPNVHVVVDDDPSLDKSIVSQGLDDDASYVFGFASEIEVEATAHVPRVWMPILGEGKTGYFERIYDLVRPDEIVPILPFPCADPRRTDDLLLEYRIPLFDRLGIEPRNFIHVPEQNPFAVYRQVITAVEHYSDSLKPLGGCKVVLSVLSSKLLSLGALLAAYKLKRRGQAIGIAHVQAVGYSMSAPHTSTRRGDSLVEVWLAGEAS